MASSYLTYSKYYSPEEAFPLLELLQHEDIPYSFEHEVNQLDNIYLGTPLDPMFVVKIPPSAFDRVNDLFNPEAGKGSREREAANEKAWTVGSGIKKEEYFSPEHLSGSQLFFGYFFSLFAIVGIFIGQAITMATRTQPDGSLVKIYDAPTLKHGRRMVRLGIVMTVIFALSFLRTILARHFHNLPSL